MHKNNIIRIDDLDTPVYRIFPLHRVEQIFNDRELVMVNPELWDDPFENFFLKSTFKDSSGNRISAKSLADSWFGQCWTLNADTDAMWRIYSGDKQSVRIKTTIGKLANAIWDQEDEKSSLKYYIGSVQYMERDVIREIQTKTSFGQMIYTGFHETLLMKRNEFSHENEVRVLYQELDNNSIPSKNKLHKIPIDPHSLIDEVCIDPRLNDELDVDCISKKIARTGFSKDIIQSDLYRFEDIFPII